MASPYIEREAEIIKIASLLKNDPLPLLLRTYARAAEDGYAAIAEACRRELQRRELFKERESNAA
jgi:hypothetical protein